MTTKPLNKENMKYCIVKGYIKLGIKIHDKTGKIIDEDEGGFFEDWKKGRVFVLINLEKNKIENTSFKIEDLI